MKRTSRAVACYRCFGCLGYLLLIEVVLANLFGLWNADAHARRPHRILHHLQGKLGSFGGALAMIATGLAIGLCEAAMLYLLYVGAVKLLEWWGIHAAIRRSRLAEEALAQDRGTATPRRGTTHDA